MRWHHDLPVLVVSQDCELFFDQSAAIDNCLFEPCEMLLDFAEQRGMHIRFYVDAGMQRVTQILYQAAIAIAAVDSFGE